MGSQADAEPAGPRPTSGVVHNEARCQSLRPLNGSPRRPGRRGTLFLVVDHSGEAQRVGMTLRDTTLLVFGNPVGGTPAMVPSPLVALDLPLKVLVWMEDDGVVWMSYLDAGWLAARHGLAAELAVSAVGGRPPDRPGRNLIDSVDRAEAIAH